MIQFPSFVINIVNRKILVNKKWASCVFILLDQEAVAWLKTAICLHSTNLSILWVDEPTILHEWRFSPIVKAAMSASDIMINNMLDLSFEEIADF